MDLRVLGLALILSTLTGALFGLAPIFQTRRADAVAELKEAGAATTAGAGHSRMRAALVVAEVALALVLLVGAGLLLSSFVHLTRVDAGFAPEGLMSMRINLRAAYPDRVTWAPFYLDLPIDRVVAVAELADVAVLRPRFYSLLAASFALVALTLALVGIYGTISYSVSGRTREIGIRIALGAERRNVLGLVAGAGFRLAFAGIALGLVGAYALTRLMTQFLFGVTATDVPTFVVAALLFVATAWIACYLPARRAARLDPVRALRSDA